MNICATAKGGRIIGVTSETSLGLLSYAEANRANAWYEYLQWVWRQNPLWVRSINVDFATSVKLVCLGSHEPDKKGTGLTLSSGPSMSPLLPGLLGEAKPDRLLVNGDCFVKEAEAIEPEFKRLMFAPAAQ